jgi:hypothetical protein
VPNTLMQIRVEVLRRNLESIHDLSGTLEGRYQRHEDLRVPLEHAKKSVTDVLHKVSSTAAKMQPGDPSEENIRDLVQMLYELPADLNAASRELVALLKSLDQIRKTYTDLPGDREQLKQYLVSAQGMISSLTPATYMRYREQVEALFADYVDVLAGLALRDAGFSKLGEIFTIAEELPRACGPVEGFTWKSFAVPSTDEGLRRSQSMVLHVGFPEWTLWAVPLVQHEFSYELLTKTGMWLTDDASEQGRRAPVGAAGRRRWHEEESERRRLADIAATLVTGPAYASAMLALRLDPSSVGRNDDVTRRSASVLAALKHVADQMDEGSTLPLVAERMQCEWVAAVKETSGKPDALKEHLEATDAITDTAEHLARYLHPPWLWAMHWDTTHAWAENMVAETAIDLGKRRKRYQLVELLMLMNAAWLCRIAPTEAGDVTDPDQLVRIAKTAADLCRDLIAWDTSLPSSHGAATKNPGALT